jgi:hypothetical protein
MTSAQDAAATGSRDRNEGAEQITYVDPTQHYHISGSKKNHQNVASFLASNKDEPAYEVSSLVCYSSYCAHIPAEVPSTTQEPPPVASS